jgi:plastocyanin
MNRSPARCATLCLLAVLALTLAAVGQQGTPARPQSGTISGTVRYPGTVPPAKKILTTDGNTLLHNDLIVDAKTKGLRDVMLLLEDAPAQPKAAKAPKVFVDQRDMLFQPRVVAVRHGQTVRFENNDTCNHAVIAHSPVAANEFNVTTPQGQPYEHTFAPQKAPVMIGCPMHPWMRAWVFVVPHPWFAVTDAQGRFRIADVPPGRYTLWLRHPDTGKQERRQVEVKANQSAELRVDWTGVGR